MKTMLENMFSRPDMEIKTCTIVSLLSPGRYSVTDQAGRTLQAESDQFWRPGSAVRVQSGRIVAAASLPKTQKIYEV
jgi:hypothetical protein